MCAKSHVDLMRLLVQLEEQSEMARRLGADKADFKTPMCQIRQMLLLTSAEFATRIGVTDSAVRLWEKGRSIPAKKGLLAIRKMITELQLGNSESVIPRAYLEVLMQEEQPTYEMLEFLRECQKKLGFTAIGKELCQGLLSQYKQNQTQDRTAE